jgi:hypothetical protein
LRTHDEHSPMENLIAISSSPASHELQLKLRTPSSGISSPTSGSYITTNTPPRLLQYNRFGMSEVTTYNPACRIAMCPPAQHGGALPRSATRALPRFGRHAACSASYHHASCAPIMQVLYWSWRSCSRLSERVVHSRFRVDIADLLR